jgi:hypothetical protein
MAERLAQHPADLPRSKAEDPGAGDRLKLARCGQCRSPIGRIAPGSRVELKCRHCGTLTSVEQK